MKTFVTKIFWINYKFSSRLLMHFVGIHLISFDFPTKGLSSGLNNVFVMPTSLPRKMTQKYLIKPNIFIESQLLKFLLSCLLSQYTTST